MAIATRRQPTAQGARLTLRFLAIAALAVAAIVLAAVLFLQVRGGDGNEPALFAAGSSTFAGIALPAGWEEVDHESAYVFEARSDIGRILVSRVASESLPVDATLYTAADVYTPAGAAAGSRYVSATDPATGVHLVGFTIPAGEGLWLRGQAVAGPEASAEAVAELVAVAEGFARQP
jgi:hypothetical protein